MAEKIDLSAGIVESPIDLSGGTETKPFPVVGKPPQSSPWIRGLKGAASEGLGFVENAPLNPYVQATSDVMSRAMSKAPPPANLLYPLVKSTLENTVGQALSGNMAGTTGAVATDVMTLGLPRLLKFMNVPRSLEASAMRQYGKVLSTTKEVPKAIAETKVIPGALERRVMARSFEGLKAKVARNLEESTAELDRVWKSLPAGSQIDTDPIYREIQDRIANTYIEGTRVLERPEVKRQYDLISDKLNRIIAEQTAASQVAGGDAKRKISVETARSWRQLMDKFIASKPGGFAITKPLAAEAEAKKVATNAIRGELAREYPDIAKVNAEYSFWKNFDEILSATSTRRTGQEANLGRNIVMSAGAAAGLPLGATSTILDAATLGAIYKASRSTGWRTVNAAVKDGIAKAIVNGDAKYLNALLKMVYQSEANNWK